MEDMEIRNRLTELEIVVTHHEKTIDELNEVIIRQEKLIDHLQKQVDAMQRLYMQDVVKPQSEETPPPHY